MSAPSPAQLADTLPLPRATFRAGRRRQVERLEAELDAAAPGSKAWRDCWSRLVWTQQQLARLEAGRG